MIQHGSLLIKISLATKLYSEGFLFSTTSTKRPKSRTAGIIASPHTPSVSSRQGVAAGERGKAELISYLRISGRKIWKILVTV